MSTWPKNALPMRFVKCLGCGRRILKRGRAQRACTAPVCQNALRRDSYRRVKVARCLLEMARANR